MVWVVLVMFRFLSICNMNVLCWCCGRFFIVVDMLCYDWVFCSWFCGLGLVLVGFYVGSLLLLLLWLLLS